MTHIHKVKCDGCGLEVTNSTGWIQVFLPANPYKRPTALEASGILHDKEDYCPACWSLMRNAVKEFFKS